MQNLKELTDLASERLGGKTLLANDDFFAEKENLLKPEKPIFLAEKFTSQGKWMDGWETRRRRTPGYDWCIVKLGVRGNVRGLVVDTAFFTGNYPESCSVDACDAPGAGNARALLKDPSRWTEIVPKTPLKGDTANEVPVRSLRPWTHLRLNIFPDGGVARLRVHGDVIPDWQSLLKPGKPVDLAAVANGALVLSQSDMHYGRATNMLMPGRAPNMGDGWETKRRRGPGHDWCVIKLGATGALSSLEIDTNHFKGNFPDTCSIEGTESLEGGEWVEVLPRTKLQAHTRHLFSEELLHRGPLSHLRLNVFPDGGVSRMRVFGVATDTGRGDAAAKRIDTLTPDIAERELRNCCGSTTWVQQMVDARPFETWDELENVAEEMWFGLQAADWHEALAAHPRIGEKKAAPSQAAAAAKWSSEEQSLVAQANETTITRLAEVNRLYEERFGHIYIICATGRSAEEMLAIAEQRLGNDRDTELRVAAEEQMKITKLRLMKLVG